MNNRPGWIPAILLVAFMIAHTVSLFAQTENDKRQMMSNEKHVMHRPGFHDFRISTLSGESLNLVTLRGKRVLIVNTASECGQTPQYAQLQELYEMYGGDDFVVIGFPSNDFGAQEPGSNEEIAVFCKQNYGVSFPIMTKVHVKGDETHPIYQWLTQKELNGMQDVEITWNFDKFLIDENGNWVGHFPSRTSPLDDRIVKFAKGKKE